MSSFRCALFPLSEDRLVGIQEKRNLSSPAPFANFGVVSIRQTQVQ